MRGTSRRVSNRKLWLTSAGGAIAALVLATAVPAASQETSGTDEVFQLTTVYGLNNTGLGNLSNHSHAFISWDISWVDNTLHKYYLADRSNKTIDILDLSTLPPTLTQVVNDKFQGSTGNSDTSGPDGVLTANNSTELWVGDTGGTCFPDPNPLCGPGQVWVLSSKDASVKTLPGGVKNPISVGGKSRADELCYDPKDNLIMIASPAEGYVTFINTKTYKVVGTLTFDGGAAAKGIIATNGIEQCQYDAASGKFLQNIPENNGAGDDTSPGGIAVIDPTTRKVTEFFEIPLDACAGPQGMTIGPNNQVLEGCNAASPNGHRNSVIVNAKTGKVLSVLTDLGGADEVWFNAGDGHYIIPFCNTPCRTRPTGFVLTGPELLGLVDSNTLQLDATVLLADQNSSTAVAAGTIRYTHSVAGDSANKLIILPIPAVGGNSPQFSPSLCDQTGFGISVTPPIGTPPQSPSTAVGCIVVLAAALNNDVLAGGGGGGKGEGKHEGKHKGEGNGNGKSKVAQERGDRHGEE